LSKRTLGFYTFGTKSCDVILLPFMKDLWSLVIFVLLLFAIVLLIVFQYFSKENEGFISFNYGTHTLDFVIVPTYSPKIQVCLLYDNLYFDTNNGNLIQVLGSAYNSTTPNVDISGNSITSVIVTTRNQTMTTNVITTSLDSSNKITNKDSSQSQIKSMNNAGAFTNWIYSSNGSFSNNTDNYQVLYIAWNNYTFIDVIDTSNDQNSLKCCTLFGDSGPMQQIPTINNHINLSRPNIAYLSDSHDLSTINAKFYGSTSVFQILNFLYFDTTNGNLLFVNNTSAPYTLNSYMTRDKTIQTTYNQANIHTYYNNTQFNVYTFQFDPSNTNPISVSTLSNSTTPAPYFIYYVANQQNTIVIVLQKNTNQSMSSINPFSILQIARFDQNKYISPSNFNNNETGNDKHWGNKYNGRNGDEDDSNDSDYGANNYGDQKNIDALLAAFLLREQMDYLNTNYIPKSQLVPPVFPVIQSCPVSGNGSCRNNNNGNNNNGNNNNKNNNNGNNNNGNSDGSGNNNSSNNDNSGAAAAASFGNNLVNATTGLVNNTVNGAVDLTKQAIGGTVGLAEAAGGGVTNTVNNTVNGAVDLTKQAVGGTVNLVESAGSGIGNGVNNAVSGAVNLGQQTVGGAVSLGQQTVGGAVDLTKQAVGGTVDLTKQAVGGTADALGIIGQSKGTNNGAPGAPGPPTNGVPYYMQPGYQVPSNLSYNPQQPQPYFMQPGYTTVPINYVNNAAPGLDGYSYYGVLPNTASSDFMPLTASFSAFGK